MHQRLTRDHNTDRLAANRNRGNHLIGACVNHEEIIRTFIGNEEARPLGIRPNPIGTLPLILADINLF